ncbi:MAG TPA: ABC transporter ATP-binding protein [Dehalococcoidia bacterium]|nr:ABC transporter ATP-binding protein [Dehalococcoidia bacterium]
MTSSDQPILEVKNLETHFPLEEGTVVAVNGASFKVMPGKTLGIVGESGCGKSVAARSIMRILDKPGEIVGGEILFRRNMGESSEEVVDIATMDSNSSEIKSIRGGEIAYVFQEPMTSFSPVHTIGNQIIEAIRLHQDVSKEGAREIAIHALNAVGIPLADSRLKDYSFQLSGGLRQRAMIAMTLVSNPIILIADEPTTALDVTNQAQLLELMSELQSDNGMAIILITHDLGVIAEMADHVSVMYLGEVVESAPVDDIFHNPQHPYTKALLKSIPKIRSDSSERLASISGTVPHPYDRPQGCAFGPRCDFFMPGRCDASIPVLQEVRPVHQVSCFLYDEGD